VDDRVTRFAGPGPGTDHVRDTATHDAFLALVLTPLTCRVIGAIFCLGIAGLGVLADPRWSSLTILLEVEMIMIPLMLVAALRAPRELHSHRVLTWLLGGGFVAVVVGSVYLWVAMTAGRRVRSGSDEPAQAENAGLLEDRE
jgi:hypothetical protein